MKVMSEEPENNNVVDSVKDDVEIDAAEAVETVEPAPQVRPAPRATTTRAVVGGGDTDAVLLSRCVYKSKATRKSLSVHHLQRRLVELGYADAMGDKDGWYGDLTLLAVKAFQAANNLKGEGIVDAETLVAIFKDDANVTVDIDN